jgi:uncharacterized protein YqjF (DUF2071 family)
MSSVLIDRLTPTRRPHEKPAGTQEWRNLLFMHWPVDPVVLRGLVPAPLELDLYEGTAWVGIVPFAMRNIAPWWLPGSLAFNFLECNLRVYVTCRGEPGVYFFSLDASSLAAVMAARIGWSLPYFHAEMSETMPEQQIQYRVNRKNHDASLCVRWQPGTMLPLPLAPESLEFFLFERYLLFTLRGKAVLRGQVAHTPYPVCSANVLHVQESLCRAVGLPAACGLPPLAHWSPGVDVEVFDLRTV